MTYISDGSASCPQDSLLYRVTKIIRGGDRHIIVATEDGQQVSIYGSFVIEEELKAEKAP